MTTLTTDDPESLLLRALHVTQQAHINALLVLNMRYYAALQRLAVVHTPRGWRCSLCHRTGLTAALLTHCGSCLLVAPSA
jgi:hypothetical protein